MVPHEYVTTTFELPGFRVKRNLGVVRGIVVRSRSIFGTFGAGLVNVLGLFRAASEDGGAVFLDAEKPSTDGDVPVFAIR